MRLPQWLRQLAHRWSLQGENRPHLLGQLPRRTRRRPTLGLEMLEDRLTPSSDVLMIGTTLSPYVLVPTNQPSGATIVQLQDGNGNPITLMDSATVTLSSSSSTGQFLDLSGKPLANSTVTIPGGSSYALFEYEDSQAGNPTITANLTSSTLSGQTTFNVHNDLAFTTPSQVLAPNQPGTLTVQLQDGKGNPITATSDVTLNLSSFSSTGKFLDTAGNPLNTPSVKIAAGSNSASFEYEDSQAQNYPTTITVSATTSAAYATQNEYVGMPIAITTPSQSLAPNQLSNPITVQLENPASSDMTINLTSTSTGGQFFDTSGNLLPSTTSFGFTTYTLTIPTGNTSASFKYEDSQTGTAFLQASTSDHSANASTQEYVGVPQGEAVIVSPWQALAVGQASHPILVQLQNQNGSPITLSYDLPLTLTSSSNSGTFLDTSGHPISSIVIPAGSSLASFEYEDTQVGIPQLEASGANGFLPGLPQSEEVGTVKLNFTTNPQTFPAGQPSQSITVQLQDSNGNPINSSANISYIQLSSSLPSGKFLDTSGQPLNSSEIPLPANSSSASFEYESTWGGKPTLTATYLSSLGYGTMSLNGPALTATQQETIQGPSSLVFTTSPQTVGAGQMSGVVTVQLKDTNGNVATAPSGGATISLSGLQNGLQATFYDVNGNPLPTNVGPFGPTATLTIPAGQSQGSFTFKSTKAGTLPINASVSGAFSATQNETIQGGTPLAVGFGSMPQSVLAGLPSGSILVQLFDQYGNAVSAPSGGVTVNLSTSSSGGQFLSAGGTPLSSASIIIPEGSSSAVVEYEDSQSGTPTLTLSTSAYGTQTQKETIVPLSGSVLHVTNTNDSGNGSLRAEIAAANASPGSTIVFDAGVTGTIDLLSALPALTNVTNIVGPGANLLTIERSSSATTDFGIFVMGIYPTQANPQPSEPIIALSGLTIANSTGTGITNLGNLLLQSVIVSNNQAPASNPNSFSETFPFGPPGGIGNVGILTVLNSTIANNSTTNNEVAAGIDSESGFVTIVNSTISGNTDNNSNSAGGVGIYGGDAYIANSTISGNTATQQTGTPNNSGGGIDASGNVILYDTIVAGNTGSVNNPTDVSGTFTSLGHNLIGVANNQSSGFVSSDQVGTTASPIDAKLGPLTSNGGPTPTMALLTGSPAIAAGSSVNAPSIDQRGDARPQGAIDIGAFEITTTSSATIPSITAQPTSQAVTTGSNVSFTAAATGNPTPTVQWQLSTDGGHSFSDISGATSTTLTLNNVTTSLNNNEYRAVFSNSAGSTPSNAATLTVTATPVAPTITTQPISQSVSAGDNVAFTAAASGVPTPTVQWQISTDGGKTFTNLGVSTPTLVLTNVDTSLNGFQYRALFSNSAGSVTSNAATLTVSAAVSPSPSPSPSPASPPAPPLNTPPILAFFEAFLGGTETVNADGSVTVTSSFFGFPLLVSNFDSSGHLESVYFFGFNVTILFELL